MQQFSVFYQRALVEHQSVVETLLVHFCTAPLAKIKAIEMPPPRVSETPSLF
jgi:hypothetical protein